MGLDLDLDGLWVWGLGCSSDPIISSIYIYILISFEPPEPVLERNHTWFYGYGLPQRGFGRVGQDSN